MSVQSLLHTIDGISTWVGKATSWLMILLMSVVCIEVFKRYAVNMPTAWIFDAENMMTVDGDYHRKLRMAFRPMFSRAVIARWEKRVAEVVSAQIGIRRDDRVHGLSSGVGKGDRKLRLVTGSAADLDEESFSTIIR